ncbi:MAG: hypothetical protein A3G18_04950 [Rhodospirillales bacterium RIFCSPLOWO2_12_FULL_58_28]|nr:MAG: hypothetical protein A3H92_03800 [Rhodospirillales bacterium RIFCSPLOWO2_02_FULL_58_16]OHC78261.1 MAG: hypothetical protein A3G18_04950 [Rhodospirillales bacterium RIFCSPLOWO2_12_FULL_58_28]
MMIFNPIRKCRNGATAVEFALVAPVFLLMIAIIMELGRVLWIKNTMQYAVEEAGRYAMVNPSTVTETYLEDTLGPSKVIGAFSGAVTFTATLDNAVTPNTMTIVASYTYTPVIGLVPGVSVPLSSLSVVPLNN